MSAVGLGNPDFSSLHEKREIGGKIGVFDRGKGNDFWFKLSGGSRNQKFEESGLDCNKFLIT